MILFEMKFINALLGGFWKRNGNERNNILRVRIKTDGSNTCTLCVTDERISTSMDVRLLYTQELTYSFDGWELRRMLRKIPDKPNCYRPVPRSGYVGFKIVMPGNSCLLYHNGTELGPLAFYTWPITAKNENLSSPFEFNENDNLGCVMQVDYLDDIVKAAKALKLTDISVWLPPKEEESPDRDRTAAIFQCERRAEQTLTTICMPLRSGLTKPDARYVKAVNSMGKVVRVAAAFAAPHKSAVRSFDF